MQPPANLLWSLRFFIIFHFHLRNILPFHYHSSHTLTMIITKQQSPIMASSAAAAAPSLLQQVGMAGSAAVITVSFIHPIDVVKVCLIRAVASFFTSFLYIFNLCSCGFLSYLSVRRRGSKSLLNTLPWEWAVP